jgi:hypothetical protein
VSIKTLSVLAGAVMALAAATPASALVYTFAANMNGPNEPSASTGFGTALVTFDDAAYSVGVSELWAGLSGPVTGNHIHSPTAVAGTGTGPIALGFNNVPALATGGYFNAFTLTPSAFSTLLTATQAGKSYVNMHTSANPGGEIRGFLVSTPVPEPGTYALMLAGAAALGFVVRKRRHA